MIFSKVKTRNSPAASFEAIKLRQQQLSVQSGGIVVVVMSASKQLAMICAAQPVMLQIGRMQKCLESSAEVPAFSSQKGLRSLNLPFSDALIMFTDHWRELIA